MPDFSLSQLPLDELLRRLGMGNMGLLNPGSAQHFGPVLGNASAGSFMPGQRGQYGYGQPVPWADDMVRQPQQGVGHDANAYQPNDLMLYDWLKRFGVPQERA